MKKYIVSFLVFFGLFVLTGCSGGSDNISNSGSNATAKPAVEIRPSELVITGNKYRVNVSFVKNIDSAYQVELNNFNFSTDTCVLNKTPVFTPNVIHLNGGINTSASLAITGTFDQNCTAGKYTFSATQKTTKNGQLDVRRYSVVYDSSNPGGGATPVPSSGFFNATTPLEITQADTQYEIKVQMLDDGYVASGKIVELKPFTSQYGDVSNYKATTGADGYATFSYTSPKTLPADGISPILELTHDADGTVITQKIVLKFQNKGTLDKVEKMYLVPSEITITSGDEEKEITILTLNAKNIGVSSTVVFEELYDGTHEYGSFDPSGPITTDSNGKAVVKYIAPSSISGISERNITVTETSENITQSLNIKYNTSTGPGIDYEIGVSVPASLSVDSADQITVTIHELGNESVIIDDANVLEVNLTTLTSNILTFNGADTETYDNVAIKPIAVTTAKLSGTAVIEISAFVFNGDRNVVLKKVLPISVLSGPVTAMSLVYTGTGEDTGVGLNKNYYTIHAVDKYNNPAKAGVMLHPSIINGTKLIKSPDVEAIPQGKISTGTQATFEDTTVDFTTFNVEVSDVLAIVPNHSKFSKNYLGNWSIDTVSPTLLELAEEFFEADTSGLSYVIGNSKRIMLDNSVATVDIQPRDGSFATDANGNVRLVVTFDPILSGHTVTISANAYEDSTRTGISQIKGLRWGHYSSTTKKVINDGASHFVSLRLGISNMNDDPIESLMDIDISPTAITSSSSQCELNSTAPMDFNPDQNGYISFSIATKATSDITECAITWSKSNGSIFREY